MTRAHAVILTVASCTCLAVAAWAYTSPTHVPSDLAPLGAVQACHANRAYLPSMMRQCLADYAAMLADRKGNR